MYSFRIGPRTTRRIVTADEDSVLVSDRRSDVRIESASTLRPARTTNAAGSVSPGAANNARRLAPAAEGSADGSVSSR